MRIFSYNGGLMQNDLAIEYDIAYNNIISEYGEYASEISFLSIENYDEPLVTKEKYILLFVTVKMLQKLIELINLFRNKANSKRNLNWEQAKEVYINGTNVVGRLVKNLVLLRFIINGKLINTIKTGQFDDTAFKLTKSVFHWWKLIVTDYVTTYDRYSRLNELYERGVEKYRFLSEEDERTCEDCYSLNDQVFKVDEAIVGINFPPIHNHCRCWIVEA